MSNQEFYEIARERVDKRIRRWTFWGIDLLVLIASLAVMILTSNTSYSSLTLAAFLGWCGVFTLHCIVAGFAENRDSEIEGEIAKLRRFADAGATYEKPKRLELSEDGELVEPDAWREEEKQRVRMN